MGRWEAGRIRPRSGEPTSELGPGVEVGGSKWLREFHFFKDAGLLSRPQEA